MFLIKAASVPPERPRSERWDTHADEVAAVVVDASGSWYGHEPAVFVADRMQHTLRATRGQPPTSRIVAAFDEARQSLRRFPPDAYAGSAHASAVVVIATPRATNIGWIGACGGFFDGDSRRRTTTPHTLAAIHGLPQEHPAARVVARCLGGMNDTHDMALWPALANGERIVLDLDPPGRTPR